MITKQQFFYVDTDKDRHFTDELLPGASEYENLVVTSHGKLKTVITSIRMRTATNHPFTLSFFSRDGSGRGTRTANPLATLAATPYQSLLIDFWPFASADAWMIGDTNTPAADTSVGTEFVYAVSGLHIPYIDEDDDWATQGGRLHVGLHNRDRRTKAALGSANLPSGVSPQYIQIRFGLITEA